MTEDKLMRFESGDPLYDSRAFRRALGQFTTGVTVVTACAQNEIVGVTANSFSSISLDPPLICWAIARTAHSLTTLLNASHFAVNILAADQIQLSAHFARSGQDKFSGVDWWPGRGGAPLLANVAACFECQREVEHAGGDHVIMVGRVQQYHLSQRDPLLYSQGRYALAAEHPALRNRLTTPDIPFRGPGGQPSLVSLLFRAYRHVSAAFERHRRLEGLTLNQSLVLAILADVQHATAEHLARLSLIPAQDIDDAVISLKELNLVSAQGNIAALTPWGRDQFAALLARSRLLEAELIGNLPDDDVASTRHILAALAEGQPDGGAHTRDVPAKDC